MALLYFQPNRRGCNEAREKISWLVGRVQRRLLFKAMRLRCSEIILLALPNKLKPTDQSEQERWEGPLEIARLEQIVSLASIGGLFKVRSREITAIAKDARIKYFAVDNSFFVDNYYS